MKTIRINLNEKPGYADVPGHTVGKTMAVHHPWRPEGEEESKRWTVTHLRTGLVVTDRHGTLADAKAYAAGCDYILRFLGDRGEWGRGKEVTSGTLGATLVRYMQAIREMPDSYLNAAGRVKYIPLTRETALEKARDAINGKVA